MNEDPLHEALLELSVAMVQMEGFTAVNALDASTLARLVAEAAALTASLLAACGAKPKKPTKPKPAARQPGWGSVKVKTGAKTKG